MRKILILLLLTIHFASYGQSQPDTCTTYTQNWDDSMTYVLYKGSYEFKNMQINGYTPFNACHDSTGYFYYDSANDQFKYWNGSIYKPFGGGSGGDVYSVNGQTGYVVLTTSNIAEGTNEYFTNARADARIYLDSAVYLAYVKSLIAANTANFSNYLTISSANTAFALKMNYTDTAGMLSVYRRKGDSSFNGGYMPWYYANAHFLIAETDPIATAKTFTATNGYGITGLSGTAQTIGSNPSITPGTDTTKLSTKAYRQKGIDSVALNFYPNTNPNGYTSNTGTVTSIVAGTGLSGGTITTTGTISMPNVGTANTYAYPSSVTTDAEGRVTSITAGSASTGTVTSVSGGTNITITGTATITPTVNISGTIAIANGGTGTTAQTSVNTTPITLGSNNTITAAPSGAAGGSLGGSYPNPTIASSVSLPGSPTTTTQSANDNTTKVSTTAYVDQYVPTYSTTTTTTTLTPTSAIADRRTPVYNTITAQGSALLIANPSGTFVDMQIIEIRLYDNGTSRTITYGSNYNAGNGTLPANTTTGKCIYEEYQYNAQSTKYDCIAGCGATAW